MKKETIEVIGIGFLLGMMALVMLAFKISTDSSRAYHQQLENERFRLIEKAEKTMGYKVENIVTLKDGTMIINFDDEMSEAVQDFMLNRK